MLIPELEQYKYKIVDQELPPKKIAKLIESAIGDLYGLTVISRKSPSLESHEMNISGFFDPEEWNEDPNIELCLIYSDKLKNTIAVDEEGWNFLSFRLYQAVNHELIHRQQSEKRFGLDPNRHKRFQDEYDLWYFEDPDEIDAHAHDIALELVFSGFDEKDAINRLRSFQSIKPSESVTLFSYLVFFKYDIGHDAIKKLIKRVVYYLEKKRGTFLCPSN